MKDAKEGSESSDEEEYVSRKDKMKMKVKQEIENERKKKAKMQKVPNDMWNSMKQNDTSMFFDVFNIIVYDIIVFCV